MIATKYCEITLNSFNIQTLVSFIKLYEDLENTNYLSEEFLKIY